MSRALRGRLGARFFGAVRSLVRTAMEALAAAASTQADAAPEGDSVVDLSDKEDGDGLSEASRTRRKKRKVPAEEEEAEEKEDDAALVRAADEAEAKHALALVVKKQRSEADASSVAPMEDAEEPTDDVMIFQTIADLQKHPHYFRNMPAEEWTVRFSKQDGQDWSAWASHKRFTGRGMPTVIPPPAAAMFAHMWPGGTLKAFLPSDAPFPAESTKDAHYTYANDLRANDELVAWMKYAQTVEGILLDKVLAHRGASARARAMATAKRQDWWNLRWPGMKREIQARDRATWTPEEVALMSHPVVDPSDPTNPANIPPLPFSEIRDFVLKNFITRLIKFRKEPSPTDASKKIDVPGTEYIVYKRPLFHVPNKEELADVRMRLKKQLPLFDEDWLRSLDRRIIPYVMEMAEMGDPSKMRLLTDIPLYTVNERGENEVVEPKQRSLFAENDVCYPVLTFRISCWTIKDTMNVTAQPQAVYFVREGDRSSQLAQIEALARKYPVRGKSSFAGIAAARGLLMIENGNAQDMGPGAAAESFAK